jgi:lambda family phage portal protein
MLTDDPTLNRQVERSFERWTAAVGLAETLRTKRQARSVDGESFGLLTTNPRVGHEVKLQLRLVEADQVATPDLATNDPLAVDGIRFDRWMNPTEYHLLAAHPGDDFGWSHQYDRIPARFVIHWFRADRPGQLRGVPEITPALGLFAQLRRYTLAVLSAAETAADFAAVLYSDMPAMAESMEGREFDLLEIERRMMTTLPAGWKMAQFKPEQPTTTYEMFKREILKEIARCLNMPRNVAQGDSSGYNYASGRLDHQVYFKSIGVDQYHCETTVLDPLLGAWLAEASGATDLLGGLSPAIADWPHRWYWDGHEHVDPAKEATAAETRLRNHTTTLAEEYARRGLDWETQLRQRAKELELMRTLGLSPADAAPPATRPDPQPTGGGDADSEDDD